MDQILLYSSLFVSFFGLFFALIACVRVAKFQKSTIDLDWDSIANLTGDIATVKRTIQTLNNRMNGMNSPKIQEQELMMQLLKNQQQQVPNGKMIGG